MALLASQVMQRRVQLLLLSIFEWPESITLHRTSQPVARNLQLELKAHYSDFRSCLLRSFMESYLTVLQRAPVMRSCRLSEKGNVQPISWADFIMLISIFPACSTL